MQNGKSSDIPISVIKKTSDIISPILANHFNYLMGTGQNNTYFQKNYRPVFLRKLFIEGFITFLFPKAFV